jgi:branched-chain amino acid transport system substrate-binding protein
MPERVAHHLHAILLFLSAFLAVLANAESIAEPRSLVIAQATDLSGPGADFGRDFSLGAKIYFDHVNANGGISGHRLLYRQADTGGWRPGPVRLDR